MTPDIFFKMALFLAGSVGLMYLSGKSLMAPGTHGFYRFFAWEGVWGLFLWNVRFWFQEPLSTPQLISWCLLIFSAYLVIASVLLLRRFGAPDRHREEVPLVGFEKTTRLVTKGVYRYLRHPLYSSLLFLAWGIFFKRPALIPAMAVVAVSLLLMATAKADEAESLRYFGSDYQAYMRKTKRFIPFLF